MKSLVLTVALIGICFSPHAICAETHTTISKQDRIAIDTIASKFADRLTASDAKGVVAVFANSSPLMSGKTAEISNLEGQVQTALNIYGKVGFVELVSEQVLGTSAIHRYYLVRHEKLVTRWQLDFALSSGGWTMTYFGFDDQQRTWFKD